MRSCTDSVRNSASGQGRRKAALSVRKPFLRKGNTAYRPLSGGGATVDQGLLLAQCGGLENRCGIIPTVGSNPTPSAEPHGSKVN